MVSTRRSEPTAPPPPSVTPISARQKRQLGNLSSGGTGGRKLSGYGDRQDAESLNHRQWNLHNSTTHDSVPQSPPETTPNIFDDTIVSSNEEMNEKMNLSSCPNIILPKKS